MNYRTILNPKIYSRTRVPHSSTTFFHKLSPPHRRIMSSPIPSDHESHASSKATPPATSTSTDTTTTTTTTTKDNNASPTSTPLPPLSPTDFHAYNRLAILMESFHTHFRTQWTVMRNACTARRRPSGMTLRQFLAVAGDFVTHLTMHHNIEEARIFPLLAARMGVFAGGADMKRQHALIHGGLERMSAYVTQCKGGEREFRFEEFKEIMDSFEQVLWTHLDEEVRNLGAENMRKFWSMDEVRRFPF